MSRTDTRRPRRGTTIGMYPYLAMTAPAKAMPAPITQIDASDEGFGVLQLRGPMFNDERVTHHIDTASPVSAATS